MAKKLFDVGIKTIGELATANPVWLKSILKKQGEVRFKVGFWVCPCPCASQGAQQH